MSFSRELKDFVHGYQAGVDISYKRAATKHIEDNLPIVTPDDYKHDRIASPIQSSGGGRGGGVGTTQAPNEFGQNAYKYYRSKGLSHAAAAGIVGNLMQ